MEYTNKIVLSISLIYGLLVNVSTEAKIAKDCEIFNMRTLAENVTSSFHDSIQFSLTSDISDTWEMSATISDASGTNCQFIIKRRGRYFENHITCGSRSIEESPQLEEKNDALLNDVWKDVLIDTDVCNPYPVDRQCKTRLRIAYTQLFFIDVYNPEWIDTSLIPPLTIHWTEKAQSDLVVNCDMKECIVNSSFLSSPKRHWYQSFFLKPRKTSEGFMLYFNSSQEGHRFFKVSDLGNYAGRWINITIDRENTTFKVLADGEQIMSRDNGDIFIQKFRISSVEMTGGGLLSWCNPKRQEKVTTTPMAAILVPSVLAATVIGIFIGYCYTKTRWTLQNQKQLDKPSLAGEPNLESPNGVHPPPKPIRAPLTIDDNELYGLEDCHPVRFDPNLNQTSDNDIYESIDYDYVHFNPSDHGILNTIHNQINDHELYHGKVNNSGNFNQSDHEIVNNIHNRISDNDLYESIDNNSSIFNKR